jgi:hypothetical protein
MRILFTCQLWPGLSKRPDNRESKKSGAGQEKEAAGQVVNFKK